jgi:hypothetical protein
VRRFRGWRVYVPLVDGVEVGIDWREANVSLSRAFGVPALEADFADVVAGITRTIRLDGHDYKVSVTGTMTRRAREATKTYSSSVNARATRAATLKSGRSGKNALQVGLSGSARVELSKLVKFGLGEFGLLGEVSHGDKTEWASGSKSYRRTETLGDVDETLYQVRYTIRVEEVRGRDAREWDLEENTEARYSLPVQHRPTAAHRRPGPVQLGVWPPLSSGVRSDAAADERPPLDFTAGAGGVYPVFATIRELAESAGRAYRRLNGWESEGEYPEEIDQATRPTDLQAHFDELVSRHGRTVPLPDADGFKQALTLKLRLYGARHTKTHVSAKEGGDGEVEIEWYLQSAAQVTRSSKQALALAASLGLGPDVRLGESESTRASTTASVPASPHSAGTSTSPASPTTARRTPSRPGPTSRSPSGGGATRPTRNGPRPSTPRTPSSSSSRIAARSTSTCPSTRS